MHTRPHRRKDQLPLGSLRDLRFLYVFAPVQHYQDGTITGPKGPGGVRENGDISEASFKLCIIPT